MRLSMQDKNEFLKAAVKAREANDLAGLVRFITALVDVSDDLPEGKYDIAVPPYRESARPNTFIPYTADQVLGEVRYGPNWQHGFSPIEPVRVDYPTAEPEAR